MNNLCNLSTHADRMCRRKDQIMGVKFRNYNKELGCSRDYFKVREFLFQKKDIGYPFGRFDWMITHSYLDADSLDQIGIWEEDDKMIGAALYDCQLGNAYCLALDGYEYLKEEMFFYAKDHLAKKDEFNMVIADEDSEYQEILAKHGFIPTQHTEHNAIFDMETTPMDYTLPEGFYIVSMKEDYNPHHYLQVLWKGFNHELDGEGEFEFTQGKKEMVDCEMIRPNVDLDLKIAVVAPNGDFVSYCGMWYDAASESALVEPVATDPAYRKMGLGKAAVLEGVRRCYERGAKNAYVGSNQQFYYNIGFRPKKMYTLWKMHER